MAKVRLPTFHPQRARLRVEKMQYVDNIEGDGEKSIEYGVVTAANPTYFLNAVALNAGDALPNGLYSTQAAWEHVGQLTQWGRAVSVVASGAAAITVTVVGRDYLGSVMREDIVLNGATPVNGKKAFRYVDKVVVPSTVAATTVSVGYINTLGMPYKFTDITYEIKNGEKSANAATFVPGLATATPSTATTNDVRGTYTPTTVVPNGTNTFEFRGMVDKVNIHGNKQFAG